MLLVESRMEARACCYCACESSRMTQSTPVCSNAIHRLLIIDVPSVVINCGEKLSPRLESWISMQRAQFRVQSASIDQTWDERSHEPVQACMVTVNIAGLNDSSMRCS